MIMLGDAGVPPHPERPAGTPTFGSRDMDADGVASQVVSPTPVFFSYAHSARTMPTTIARDLQRSRAGDLRPRAGAAGAVLPGAAAGPRRGLRGARPLPGRRPRGVEIGNHVGDRDLDDAGIVTFLQHCARVGAPVFVHPWDMPDSPRLNRWMAQWLTGMPAETHLSILAMILGGVFDRVDESLRICFAHGGGSFAFWLGRMDNAWHRRPDVIATSEHPPSHYVDRFYVDSVVFDQAALRLLVDTLGADQVMVGSDYPYPFGERPAGGVVRSPRSSTSRPGPRSCPATRGGSWDSIKPD